MANIAVKEGLHFNQEIVGKYDSSVTVSQDEYGIGLHFIYNAENCNLPETIDNTTYSLKFNFSYNYFDQYKTNEFNFRNLELNITETTELCCNTQLLLFEIISSTLTGLPYLIFLESKALALFLCYKKCSVDQVSFCTNCKFLNNPAEKEKINTAKEIILNNLHQPLTIPQLSAQLAINQCYLKKGFKEMFGTTIYDFVQTHRMQKAKLMLATSNQSVAEIANEIGFSSSSNFSTAFKKNFGIYPSELQKN